MSKKVVSLQILHPRERRLIFIKARERVEKAVFGNDPGVDAGNGDLLGCGPTVCVDKRPLTISNVVGAGCQSAIIQDIALALVPGDTVGPSQFVQSGSQFVPPDNVLMGSLYQAWFDSVPAFEGENYNISGNAIVPVETLVTGTIVTARYIVA